MLRLSGWQKSNLKLGEKEIQIRRNQGSKLAQQYTFLYQVRMFVSKTLFQKFRINKNSELFSAMAVL